MSVFKLKLLVHFQFFPFVQAVMITEPVHVCILYLLISLCLKLPSIHSPLLYVYTVSDC